MNKIERHRRAQFRALKVPTLAQVRHVSMYGGYPVGEKPTRPQPDPTPLTPADRFEQLRSMFPPRTFVKQYTPEEQRERHLANLRTALKTAVKAEKSFNSKLLALAGY